MTNYTTDTYEVKREIMTFAGKMTKGLNKPTRKFVTDMIYGIHGSGSGLLSDISRVLKENTKLINIIDRLATNLRKLTEPEIEQLWYNYRKQMKKTVPSEPIFIFDDTDIAKPYGRKFEDLDIVRDGSSITEKMVKGYHVCECVVLSEKEKQPLSIYSQIYSTRSDGFKSKNSYTLESIDTAFAFTEGRKRTSILDRGYDSNQIIDKLDVENSSFVLRLKDKRVFLFKKKAKKAGIAARQKKEKSEYLYCLATTKRR